MTPADGVALREREADLVVERRTTVADEIVALTLADPSGAELPDWRPGAHVDVMMGDGLVRQYSLCSSPRDNSVWRIAVLRDPSSRGGSRYVHDNLQEGSQVRIRGPRNNFPLVDAAKYRFIAGGIGITPILPMIEAVMARGAEWSLLYGGRSHGSMAFASELSEHRDRVRIWPQDTCGLLDLDTELATPDADTVVYCCGPEALLDAVSAKCAGWPAGSLHIERFSAKTASEPAPADAVEPFEVVCQQSGVTVEVPADKSVLDALEEEGIEILASCLEGICGTCETAVIEGVPDHRDSLLTDAQKEANDVMFVCVSRSRSKRLVLDV